jgi:hypothetical protein
MTLNSSRELAEKDKEARRLKYFGDRFDEYAVTELRNLYPS